jgi:hypothetical protein
MQVSFRLTRRGGEAWEKAAEPDWGHFISVGTYSAAGGQSEPGEVISANRDLVIAYMGWYPEVNREKIQLETINGKPTRTLMSSTASVCRSFTTHRSRSGQPKPRGTDIGSMVGGSRPAPGIRSLGSYRAGRQSEFPSTVRIWRCFALTCSQNSNKLEYDFVFF